MGRDEDEKREIKSEASQALLKKGSVFLRVRGHSSSEPHHAYAKRMILSPKKKNPTDFLADHLKNGPKTKGEAGRPSEAEFQMK